jgi:hypothetical protein
MQAFLRAVGLRFRPSLSGQGARDADIGGQVVRLRPRRATEDGPVASVHVGIPTREPADVDLLGVRWRIRPAAGGD